MICPLLKVIQQRSDSDSTVHVLMIRMRKQEIEYGAFKTFTLAGEDRSISKYFLPNGSTTDKCLTEGTPEIPDETKTPEVTQQILKCIYTLQCLIRQIRTTTPLATSRRGLQRIRIAKMLIPS